MTQIGNLTQFDAAAASAAYRNALQVIAAVEPNVADAIAAEIEVLRAELAAAG